MYPPWDGKIDATRPISGKVYRLLIGYQLISNGFVKHQARTMKNENTLGTEGGPNCRHRAAFMHPALDGHELNCILSR